MERPEEKWITGGKNIAKMLCSISQAIESNIYDKGELE